MKNKKPCSLCGGTSHTAMTCFLRPKKPMQAKKQLKAHKPMKKMGAMARKYKELRKEFFKLNPAPHYCYYCLYIGIEQELEEKDTQVEHYLTKAKHEKLRLEQSNLVKSCAFHNEDKSHMDGPDYLKKLEDIHGRN